MYFCHLDIYFSFDFPRAEDEDIIFEDFARLRVRAANQNDDPFES